MLPLPRSSAILTPEKALSLFETTMRKGEQRNGDRFLAFEQLVLAVPKAETFQVYSMLYLQLNELQLLTQIKCLGLRTQNLYICLYEPHKLEIVNQ